MSVNHGKVQLREPVPQDIHNAAVWALDNEIMALDPPAGTTFNEARFSIYTLDGKHIGVCSLYNGDGQSVQLGIRIGDKDYHSRGYGTDAVNAMVDWCIELTSYKHIWLKVLPENIRAIRCYEKCGFVTFGTLELAGYTFTTMERNIQ